MKKILYIAPHLSTGGQPQYLLKKIELLNTTYDIYVIEYAFIAAAYVVQRNKIQKILGKKFYSLGENKSEIFNIIDKISPDIIHMEEIPEIFMNEEIARKIYRENRTYVIFETSHTVDFNPKNKVFFPDKFLLVSDYQLEQYKEIDIPKEVVDYPIEAKERPDRKKALSKLGLDTNKKHILIVGLFTPLKNQGYVFKLAELLPHHIFHFVGNQAGNFESYWKPLMKNKPNNCIIWGERNDVDNFYSCCDLLIFPSYASSGKAECNPLVVKEALSWGLKVLMFNMDSYNGRYDSVESIHFLTGREIEDLKTIEDLLNYDHLKKKIKIVHMVTSPDTLREKESIEQLSKLKDFGIEYVMHNNEPYTKKPPVETCMKPEKVTETFGDARLSPAHYGCYLAHKYAILSEFTDDTDFLIVAEADCKIIVPLEEFVEMIYKVGGVMEQYDITYFSFGDPLNIVNGELISQKVRDFDGIDFMYETNKIICAHCIMFKKDDRDFLINALQEEKWNVADLWYINVFWKHNKKMAILNKPMAIQMDGYSLIDRKEKKYYTWRDELK